MSLQPMKLFEGKYKERSIPVAKELFKLMGIAREDKEKRKWWVDRTLLFFDAPISILVCSDVWFEELYAQFDIGLLVENRCLVALNLQSWYLH